MTAPTRNLRRTLCRSISATTALATALATAAVGTLLAISAPAEATPVVRQVRIPSTDWTVAGAGGIGQAAFGGGTASIAISGVSGTVSHAYLSWNGIGPNTGTRDSPVYSGAYDNPGITVDGSPVQGTSQGESGSNCWSSSASSRTYLADVTSLVKGKGNGTYDLAGLGDGGDANGASLIVTYQDGDLTNDRDLYLFYGNDTDADGFPGEDTVWNDPLADVNYQGGDAQMLVGVADGQDFGASDDGSLNVTGGGGTVTFADDATNNGLWDGKPAANITDAGHSRATNGSLLDLPVFDVTSALGDPGVQDLSITSALVNDCHSLTTVGLSVPATGAQPPAPATVSVSPASVVEGTADVPPGNKKKAKLNFVVSLSSKATTDTTVTLQTQDNTATSPADFRASTRTITIPAGKRNGHFKVAVVGDSVGESNETLFAVITSASVPVATGAALGTIVDDDTTALTAPSARGLKAATGGHLAR